MARFIPKITGFVLNKYVGVLSITGFVLNVTGFVQNKTGLVLKDQCIWLAILIVKRSIQLQGLEPELMEDKQTPLNSSSGRGRLGKGTV